MDGLAHRRTIAAKQCRWSCWSGEICFRLCQVVRVESPQIASLALAGELLHYYWSVRSALSHSSNHHSACLFASLHPTSHPYRYLSTRLLKSHAPSPEPPPVARNVGRSWLRCCLRCGTRWQLGDACRLLIIKVSDGTQERHLAIACSFSRLPRRDHGGRGRQMRLFFVI